ncbi:MAG TPA: hypothetical protein VL919_16820 [Vicinamibacterales bacterium]|jgi:hypothetical protein|nr:hypothetical protein [Vicinamibacterales bacterium]
MTRRAIGKAFLLGAALTTLSISLSAQRTITRLVYISAVDEAETAVLNLTNADFRITENGLQREVTRATLLNGPMRIVLLVDSSTPVGPMLNNFRTALNAFIDELPEEEEVVFVSSGGQIRVRTQPGTDRVKLRAEVSRFAAEGGANAFLDTMLEADKRFLKNVPAGQWPAFVIVTTDRGENTREPNIKDYNNFMQDFLSRGGAAHAVIIAGKNVGSVTDMVANLVDNVAGMRHTIVADSNLPARLREIANRLADDHQRMMRRYELRYAGDPSALQPTVVVTSSRDGVQLQMSVRRPF